MLNKNNERALAHVEKITMLEPIENADKIELASILGWKVVVKKDEFSVGEKVVYIEVDSKVPEREEFEFLRPRKFKVKTIKLRGVYSQGLIVPLSILGRDAEVGEDVTDELKITYSSQEDMARKGKPNNDAKYISMKARHRKLFQNRIIKRIYKHPFGKKVLFALFGKKKDKPKTFPTHFPFVHKTDEERIENMPWILNDKEPWIKTQKIDGTSTTFILEKKKFGKYEEYVCSRNVRMLKPSQKTYHDTAENVYWEMADKYKIFDFLKVYIEKNNLTYAALQGETAGPSLQGNPHKFKERLFFGYNLIRSDTGRVDSVSAAQICAGFNIPWVPIADFNYILPDTMEEAKLDADGGCLVGEGPREGWVYRSLDGKKSFKNVSRKYLLKHDG